MVDRHPDQHVQGLADRIAQLEAQRTQHVRLVNETLDAIARVDRRLGTVRARYVAALARASKTVVDEARALTKERLRARNAKAKKYGQFVVIPGQPFIGAIIHIGRTTQASPTNIVVVEYLCGRGSQELGRDLALSLARQTHGELSIALGVARQIRRSRDRRRACEGCTDAARAQMRPAKAPEVSP